jgi:D-alanine--D-alanine ligase
MTRTSVGILRGGTSNEYNLSQKTGAAMMSALPEDKFDARDIFIDKRGYWHLRGVPVDAARALSQVDVVLNALHGGVGEDGSVQRLLERAGVKYAGSRPLPSALSLSKMRAREIFQQSGIKIPRGIWLSVNDDYTTGDMANAIFAIFGPPYVVKPPSEGSSFGIRIASNINELPDVIGDVLEAFGAAIVEEFIRGKEVGVGIIENFRGEPHYALPPAEVMRPTGARMIEPHMYEESLLHHAVPSDLAHSVKNELIDIARRAHKALGLSHFSHADFIVTPRAAYLLEVNANPQLHQGSAFPKMLEAVGSSIPEFVQHSVGLARA